MHLVEVSLAGLIFTAASGGSLQLWASSGAQQHRLAMQGELSERMELDRLQLQVRWRQELAATQACPLLEEQLESVAQRLMVPPQLVRELRPAEPGRGVQVVWSVPGRPELTRHRWFTPAGLGLC